MLEKIIVDIMLYPKKNITKIYEVKSPSKPVPKDIILYDYLMKKILA